MRLSHGIEKGLPSGHAMHPLLQTTVQVHLLTAVQLYGT